MQFPRLRGHKKQKALNDNLKTDDSPIFHIQVGNGQLGKPLATAKLKFDPDDTTKNRKKNHSRLQSSFRMEHNRYCDTIGEVQGNGKSTDFPFVSSTIDKRVAVRVTNTTESPYLNRKTAQIAELFAVIQEQSKYKPLYMERLNMIPQGDHDQTAHLHKLLRKNKLDQQNNSFWFPTSENPCRPEDHTPLQIRILKQLFELKEKGKINPQESIDCQSTLLERFD